MAIDLPTLDRAQQLVTRLTERLDHIQDQLIYFEQAFEEDVLVKLDEEPHLTAGLAASPVAPPAPAKPIPASPQKPSRSSSNVIAKLSSEEYVKTAPARLAHPKTREIVVAGLPPGLKEWRTVYWRKQDVPIVRIMNAYYVVYERADGTFYVDLMSPL